MSRIKRPLDLNILSDDEAKNLRESYLSNSMGGMKAAIKSLDLTVSAQVPETVEKEVTPRYERGELAEVARQVYRENINPKVDKAEYQDEGPDTHARRVEKRSIQRAIMGLRNGGDEGKTSYVGPNGSGNVGKYTPSADNGSGNATNNTNNYYALTTDMTLEEYEEYIQGKFQIDEAAPLAALAAKPLLALGGKALLGGGKLALGATKLGGKALLGAGKLGLKGTKIAGSAALKSIPAIAGGAAKAVAGVGSAVGSAAGAAGSAVKSANDAHNRSKEEADQPVTEDYIQDLKVELLRLEDSEWQSIDRVMRKIAKENFITPKQLHKEFKAQHGGQIPDEWLKENREVEMAGFIPLNELARLNPVGSIYEVTYAFRGGTQRQKFLWPSTEPPTKEQMEEIVRGFWPFARLLSFYPVMLDNEQNSNAMIAVPPVTENHKFYTPEDWCVLSAEDEETFYQICEEEGEPLCAPEQQADGTYALLISDHDTGEQKYITFGEGLTNDVRKQRGEDSPSNEDIRKKGAERQNAVAKLMQDKEMQKRMDDAIAKSVARDKERQRQRMQATGEEAVYQELLDKGYILDEGSLHDWFSKSKSKDGKPGWVQSDGSPCANEKGETKTPKCYSSQRLAGLKKTEEGRKKIKSADARKSKQDSGQQQKSGGAKPTYVRTFKDSKDLKKHPSGDTTKDESFDPSLDEACWKGYEQKGMKKMFGKMYPNCVKKTKSEEVEYVDEGSAAWQKKAGKNPEGGLNEKGRKSYERENPGSDLKAPQPEGGPRKRSFCARMGGMKGPMKDEKGKPTRKALALRKWKCNEQMTGIFRDPETNIDRPMKLSTQGAPPKGSPASRMPTSKGPNSKYKAPITGTMMGGKPPMT